MSGAGVRSIQHCRYGARLPSYNPDRGMDRRSLSRHRLTRRGGVRGRRLRRTAAAPRNARRARPLRLARVQRLLGPCHPYHRRPSAAPRRRASSLRADRLDGKTLIHNYGHGGAGMSISWGTGAMAADLALAHEHRRAAVIGCGVVGPDRRTPAPAAWLRRHHLRARGAARCDLEHVARRLDAALRARRAGPSDTGVGRAVPARGRTSPTGSCSSWPAPAMACRGSTSSSRSKRSDRHQARPAHGPTCRRDCKAAR